MKNDNKLKKLTIPLLAIPVLAASVLVGCNKNSTHDSTEMSSPDPSMANTNGMMGETNNMSGVHSMSNMNMAASNRCRAWKCGDSYHVEWDMSGTHSMSNMGMPAGANQ